MKLLQAGPFLVRVLGAEGMEEHESLAIYDRGRGEPQEELWLHLEPGRDFLPNETPVQAELPGQWRVLSPEGGGIRVQFWCGDQGAWGLEAFYSPDYSSVRVASRRGNPKENALAFHLGSPLKWMVTHRLAMLGGFLLHGVSLRRPGGKILIGSGPSGAGKSTLGSFFLSSRDFQVLTDETTAVLPEERSGRWLAWGTPWSGMLGIGRNEGAEVDCLAFLEKTEAHALRPLEKREAFRRIWSEVFPPPADPGLALLLVGHVEDFLTQVSVRELGFSKEPSVVDFLRGGEIAY